MCATKLMQERGWVCTVCSGMRRDMEGYGGIGRERGKTGIKGGEKRYEG
jgi:hypothetical protein